ncbi:MAG: radical SAM protein [Pseudomonadota bacterium]
MHFFLINVPIRLDQPPNSFPTGLALIAQVLLDKGHEVQVLDVNAHRYEPEQVIKQALLSNADAIGISGLVSTYKYQHWLIHELKTHLPGTPVIAGGGCATSIPDLMTKHTPVDFLVMGEGENTICELAAVLENGGVFEDVKGLVFRKGDEVVRTEPRPLEKDLDRFPLPAYQLFPTEIYIRNEMWGLKKRSINLVSSRGCPMDCNFCFSIFGRQSYRGRGAESIMEEVRLLKNEYGVDFFGFVDDNLTIKRKHLLTVCDALAKEEVEWGCHGRVDTADDERLSHMAQSGCKWLGFGVESGSQKILNNMNKRITVEKAKEAVLRTRKHGIFANTTFIFGYPGEDEESVKETLRLKLDLDINAGDFFATPYPGTKLYQMAIEKGLIKDEHEFAMSLNNAYNFTVNLTDMSDRDFFNLRARASHELIVALFFKQFKDSKGKEAGFLSVADEMLNKDFLLPETKRYILMGVSRHFEQEGQLLYAYKTKKLAEAFAEL